MAKTTLRTNSAPQIYLPDVIGAGYKRFWSWQGRYLVCKGSRASKKSKTSALRFIYNMMKYKEANLLVVRKTFRTLKDSCFSDLKWAANRLCVSDLWEFRQSPLEAEYKPTGQKILFRGLDDPLKVTSITVDNGVLCWGWLEEGYEILKESDFDTIDESIRGYCPPGLFKQWTITFNPWNQNHWLKKRFFDNPDKETLALTTNYQCNEWLDDSDRRLFERMKQNNPRRYRVAGLGDWGIVDGLVYENWEERKYTLEEVKGLKTFAGLDYGYTNDPTAFVIGFIDEQNRILYIWDEIYKTGMGNRNIYDSIVSAGYAKERIIADSAEPKSNAELANYGLRIKPALKGKDSVLHGIQYIQQYKIIIHPRCINTLTEITNYTWDKDKFGNTINSPIDDFNHIMDALRYGVENYSRNIKYNPVKGGL